ncbi:hypothetical protein QBC43DRAFT_263835 [Cladorrhinum sp. PSN259]|nr:hypothetical protein QBC43DRAFT_263835 [Cladorrhinum sp. PSN259]
MPPPPLQLEEPFPANFTEISKIRDEKVKVGSLISLIGLVTDCRAPVPTSGTDHKACWTLTDISTQDEAGISFNIFRPEKAMPQVSARDVVVLFKVKVQRYQNNLSLVTNLLTTIRVYKASRIPRPPSSAKVALAPAVCPRDHRPEPPEEVNRYVSVFYHRIEKYGLPGEAEFKIKEEMSLHVKNKFSLLRDVQEGRFYDIIVRIVRDPYYDHDHKATLYVSDYTENPHLHLQTYGSLIEYGGDPWGYTDVVKREWEGPDGKRSIQITLYPPHSSVLLDDGVRVGTWLHLRNVQIKHGRDGQFLEGFLREDRSYPDKINVSIIDLESATREDIDPRLKAAAQRWKAAEKEKRDYKKSIAEAKAAGESLKRKASEAALNEKEASRLNATTRRKQQRTAKDKEKSKEQNQKQPEQQYQQVNQPAIVKEKNSGSDLNGQITCESYYEQCTTIKDMLEPAFAEKEIDGKQVTLPLPFVNRKYQSRVRVVDFWPTSLEDFAVSRKANRYECLSDDGDESSSAESGTGDDGASSNPARRRTWEWRFALELEDISPLSGGASPSASSPEQSSRLWVIINNAAGQCLTNLDATDLRKKPRVLAKLREKMTVLWGNLEEVQEAGQEENAQNKKAAAREKKKSEAKSNKGKSLLVVPKPTLTSSDVEMEDDDTGGAEEVKLDNKPFMCCISQYGVNDPNTQKWVRTFGMFGVRIRA